MDWLYFRTLIVVFTPIVVFAPASLFLFSCLSLSLFLFSCLSLLCGRGARARARVCVYICMSVCVFLVCRSLCFQFAPPPPSLSLSLSLCTERKGEGRGEGRTHVRPSESKRPDGFHYFKKIVHLSEPEPLKSGGLSCRKRYRTCSTALPLGRLAHDLAVIANRFGRMPPVGVGDRAAHTALALGYRPSVRGALQVHCRCVNRILCLGFRSEWTAGSRQILTDLMDVCVCSCVCSCLFLVLVFLFVCFSWRGGGGGGGGLHSGLETLPDSPTWLLSLSPPPPPPLAPPLRIQCVCVCVCVCVKERERERGLSVCRDGRGSRYPPPLPPFHPPSLALPAWECPSIRRA